MSVHIHSTINTIYLVSIVDTLSSFDRLAHSNYLPFNNVEIQKIIVTLEMNEQMIEMNG